MFGKITIVLNLMVKRERRFGATIRGAKVEIRITSKKGVETVCTGGSSA